MKMRDYQRIRVYRADWMVTDAGLSMNPAIGGRDLEHDVWPFVVDIVESDWWTEQGGMLNGLIIGDGETTRVKGAQAQGGNGVVWMTLPRWARRELQVFHELAHCLHDHQFGRDADKHPRWTAAHGREFVRNQRGLVQEFGSAKMYRALCNAQDFHGVRHEGSDHDYELELQARREVRLASTRRRKR